MSAEKRTLQELYLRTNLHRLSGETLERIIEEIEPEVEKSIGEELEAEEKKGAL